LSNLPIAPSPWIILGPVLLLAAVSLLIPLVVRTKRQTPDSAWRGILYYNPDDRALFVPKRYGIGYTLNFANPWCWPVLAMILALVALPIILSIALTTRHLPK
jgi:uncharacterized membrane protein